MTLGDKLYKIATEAEKKIQDEEARMRAQAVELITKGFPNLQDLLEIEARKGWTRASFSGDRIKEIFNMSNPLALLIPDILKAVCSSKGLCVKYELKNMDTQMTYTICWDKKEKTEHEMDGKRPDSKSLKPVHICGDPNSPCDTICMENYYRNIDK